MSKTYKVKFTATFEATVLVKGNQSLKDAVADINIPENAQCRYVEGTFEPAAGAIGPDGSVLIDPPITLIQVTNSKGLKFNVRLVRPGDKYGLNNCLTHNETEPMVEFYDVRYPHTTFGQFVSRYCLSTLLERPWPGGLDLDGGVPDWEVSAENMQTILKWLQTI